MKKLLTIILLLSVTCLCTGCLTPVERSVAYPAFYHAAKWYYFGIIPTK